MTTAVKVALFLACALLCAAIVRLYSARIKESAWFARHVTVSFGSVTYTTTALNGALQRWLEKSSPWQIRVLRLWFSVGAVYGILAMFAALLLLLCNAYFQLTILRQEWLKLSTPPSQLPKGGIDISEPILTPVLPGINLPFAHAVYFILALALNAVVHELGHAVAAMCEGVRINSFGIFVYMLYPGAFCDLKTDDLQILHPVQKLRIFSAGVFHNIGLAGLAFFCLRVALPFILMCAYETGVGAVVVDIYPNSAIYRHLPIGSRIIGINGALKINTASDWYTAIRLDTETSFDKEHATKRTGYCSSVATAKEGPSFRLDDASDRTLRSSADCCEGIPQGSAASFCFLYYAWLSPEKQQVCLPARKTVTSVACASNDECRKSVNGNGEIVCLFPSLARGETLVKIELEPNDESSSLFVLYTGDPRVLGASVYATDHAPRHWLFGLKIPQRLETMLRYMIALSVALSCLNIVPSLHLDGQYAMWALLDIFGLGERAPLFIFLGTILIGVNVLFAFIILFVR